MRHESALVDRTANGTGQVCGRPPPGQGRDQQRARDGRVLRQRGEPAGDGVDADPGLRSCCKQSIHLAAGAEWDVGGAGQAHLQPAPRVVVIGATGRPFVDPGSRRAFTEVRRPRGRQRVAHRHRRIERKPPGNRHHRTIGLKDEDRDHVDVANACHLGADRGSGLLGARSRLLPMQRLDDLLPLANRGPQLQLRAAFAGDVEHHAVDRAAALWLLDHDRFVTNAEPAAVACPNPISERERLV